MSKRPREQRDVNPRPVILAGAGLLLGLVIVLAAMAGLLALFSPPGGLSAAPAAPQPAGEPQLQVIPPAERLSLEATQTARLHGYGWVSKEAGTAHIPIERAMSLLITRSHPITPTPHHPTTPTPHHPITPTPHHPTTPTPPHPTTPNITFTQHPNAPLPLTLPFVDENGRPVQLGDYFAADRPVVLTLGYYECPRLCGLVFKETADALRGLQGLTVGADFTVLSVSIDPGETPAIAAAKKAAHVSQAGPAAAAAAAGWHFLTGQQAAIDRLADAVGFRYAYDPASDQFAHPTGLIVLTPDGRIARYIFGIDYPPRDLRLALVDAAAGEIGSPADQLLLLCYRYDPQTGRYTPLIASAIRWAGLGTVLLLGLVLGRAWRRE